jgi:periplasmic divalent cation tolerance protein
MEKIFIGYTTTENKDDAEKLAFGLIKNKIAACVQIDGPMESVYTWQDKMEKTSEYRLTVKFINSKADEVQKWIRENHPYEIPQWIVFEAKQVSAEYLSWAESCCK